MRPCYLGSKQQDITSSADVSPRHSNLESGARDYLKGLKEDFLLGHEMRLLHGLEDFHLDHVSLNAVDSLDETT